MNLAKARDYFSAYYEGSLDRGLKQSFEARLREDAQLQAEYKAFERTLKGLEALGRVEIEPPADLHEKIAARLDRAIWEQKREKSRVFSLNWTRGVALGGITAIAVMLLLVFGLKSHFQSEDASLFPAGQSESAHFVFAGQSRSVLLSYGQVNHETIVFRDVKGKVLKSLPLDHAGINNFPIRNRDANAQLVSVETTDQSAPESFVALPGKLQDPTTSGKGAVKDMALALAAHYQHPVVVQVGDGAQQDASWDFTGSDPIAAADASLSQLDLVVSQDSNGLISITKS